MGTNAIFMDDNARPHRARLVRSYLESETIPQMTWLAISPDLNPNEDAWNLLRIRIAGRSVPPAPSTSSNKPYYRNGHYCHKKRSKTIASMPRRYQACISVRGYETRY
ncbi:hypothetical protein AVEN_162645-1 [Araneus ventricosus]|uniref:Tc1-like transposase DDE domain-containing protein n=1 Tax=Araneus ventricosus TaxID=182803 RepID=A0A4Y2FF63_ARAVE|nr:hypothetical protein AVEN_162645-1 [Araneus ventricosus]